MVTDLVRSGIEVPFDMSIESLGIDTTWELSVSPSQLKAEHRHTRNVDALRLLLNGFQRTLNTALACQRSFLFSVQLDILVDVGHET